MCGLLFVNSYDEGLVSKFSGALKLQSWRGPDAQEIIQVGRNIHMGHARLSIIDPNSKANQPMTSADGRYSIIFNGEIYNHIELRKKHGLSCRTSCDTETILEAFRLIGIDLFEQLDGMFALVIVDHQTGDWWAARDPFGIKPLFLYQRFGTTILSSECVSIRHLVDTTVCEEALNEWRVIRRPIPGRTFFKEVQEVEPGVVLRNGVQVRREEICTACSQEAFSTSHLEELLIESVKMHEMSDVQNTSLLSGGIDSSLIVALSSVNTCYTVGLTNNNEVEGALETATVLNKKLRHLLLSPEDLKKQWRYLLSIRGEPLSVPNEGLIYAICGQMDRNEKVVLTGEGADELFFGYDRLFRAAAVYPENFSLESFVARYGYVSDVKIPSRLLAFLNELNEGKRPIEFLEDFFLVVHLPGLLRRMDSASMAASKEARVPFVSKSLAKYMYRRPAVLRVNEEHSKIPLRDLLQKYNLGRVLERKKIGFSAAPDGGLGRAAEYSMFRQFVLKELGWS